jgi:hypothetical protein
MSLYKIQPNVAKILFMCQYGIFDGVEAKDVKEYDFVLNTKTDVLDDLFKIDIGSRRLATLRRLDKRMICETEFEFYSGEEFMFIDDLIWLLGKYCLDEQLWIFVREVRKIASLEGPGCFSVFKDFYHEDKRIEEYFYEGVDSNKIHTFRGAEWAHYLFGLRFSRDVPAFSNASAYIFLRDLIHLELPIPEFFWRSMFRNLMCYSDDWLYLILIADYGLRYNLADLELIPFKENFIGTSHLSSRIYSRVARRAYSCSPQVIALAKQLVYLIDRQCPTS